MSNSYDPLKVHDTIVSGMKKVLLSLLAPFFSTIDPDWHHVRFTFPFREHQPDDTTKYAYLYVVGFVVRDAQLHGPRHGTIDITDKIHRGVDCPHEAITLMDIMSKMLRVDSPDSWCIYNPDQPDQ